MARIRVGINGLGRIGRTVLKEWFSRKIEDFDIVAVNNLGTLDGDIRLLKYDSVHGRFNAPISKQDNMIVIGDKKIAHYQIKNPAEIPWEVDIVLDSTGIFSDMAGLGKHLKGKTKKVIMCAPGKDLDATFVMGINHTTYDPAKHNIVSNASCTTNCLAPIAKVLNDKFGIVSGQMTTIHSYTQDQRILDTDHSDPRRARAAALSMIPTTTGAAKATGLVIPELQGKLDGYSVRVPTPNVSLVDLTAVLKQKVTIEQVNAALKEASETSLKGILAYSTEPLVSVDYNGTRESSTVDSLMTNVVGETVKVISWYDNECGFSNRVIDLASYISKKL